MKDPASTKQLAGEISTVIAYLREERSNIDTAISTLESKLAGLIGESSEANAVSSGQTRGFKVKPAVTRLREGSKKERVYRATATCLRDGPLHIDDLMKNLPPELFENITSDKRNYLFNILSQLKSRGLLTSDNRGTWSVPTEKEISVA